MSTATYSPTFEVDSAAVATSSSDNLNVVVTLGGSTVELDPYNTALLMSLLEHHAPAPCADCGTTGYTRPSRTVECPHCRGRGWVK